MDHHRESDGLANSKKLKTVRRLLIRQEALMTESFLKRLEPESGDCCKVTRVRCRVDKVGSLKPKCFLRIVRSNQRSSQFTKNFKVETIQAYCETF